MADSRLFTKVLLATIIILFTVAATGMSKLSALTMIMIASLVFTTTIIAMCFDKAILHFATRKAAQEALAAKETSTSTATKTE